MSLFGEAVSSFSFSCSSFFLESLYTGSIFGCAVLSKSMPTWTFLFGAAYLVNFLEVHRCSIWTVHWLLLDVHFDTCIHFQAVVIVHKLLCSLSRRPGKLLSSDRVLLDRVLTFTALCVQSYKPVSDTKLHTIWPPLSFRVGLDSLHLHRIDPHTKESATLGSTVMLASTFCMNRFLVSCCTAINVPSWSSAFRPVFSIWSFSLSANCLEGTASSRPLSIKLLQRTIAANPVFL